MKPKGTGLFPHLYITLGDACKGIGRWEATCPEYFEALGVMAVLPSLPPNWAKHIHKHKAELVRMVASWDWSTCRRWLEQVFKLIADSRLSLGWDDPGAIKDLQREICTSASHAHLYPYAQQFSTPFPVQYNATSTLSSQPAMTPDNPPASFHADYNKDSDGRPCLQWNWLKECGFSA